MKNNNVKTGDKSRIYGVPFRFLIFTNQMDDSILDIFLKMESNLFPFVQFITQHTRLFSTFLSLLSKTKIIMI